MMSVPRTTVRESRHKEAGHGDEVAVGMNGLHGTQRLVLPYAGHFVAASVSITSSGATTRGRSSVQKRELQFGSDRKIRLTVSSPSDTVPTNLRIETPLDAMMVEGPWRLRRDVM